MPRANLLDRLIPAYREKALTRALENEDYNPRYVPDEP